MSRGGRKGNRNKVVIRDLKGGCNEISRRAASSKDEIKHIDCLVSVMGLGKGEGKEGESESWNEMNQRQTSGG